MSRPKGSYKASMMRAFSVVIGIAINVGLSYLVFRFDWPLYLDTIGTIGVAMVSGLFPGIFTAVFTNVFCMTFNGDAAYFGFVNALIAIYSAWYFQKKSFEKMRSIMLFITVIGVGCGVIAGCIQWGLLGYPQNESMRALMDSFEIHSPAWRFIQFIMVNVLVNLLDKGVVVGAVLLGLKFIPKDLTKQILQSGWRQRPLTEEEMAHMSNLSGKAGRSLRRRMAAMLIGASVVLVIIVGSIGVRLFFENSKAEKTEIAMNAAKFTASIVDPKRVKEYIRRGESASGYKETLARMEQIRENASGVRYLYVLTVDKDAVTFVLDLPAKEEYDYDVPDEEGDDEAYAPGTRVAIEDEFLPYLPKLLAGEEVPVIESRDKWSWIITAYYPILDEDGTCVGYAGADASVDFLADYLKEYILRVTLIMLGFFMLILAYGLWVMEIHVVYPVNAMTLAVERIINAGTDQQLLDSSVRNVRSLDIRTGDEVENLYNDVCNLAANQTEQLRSLHRFAENTAKMQDGLIITMAVLVENRDSDTGSHIQKTAAYVKIIAEGLKRNGYYTEKMTPKFMSDVVRSAPLHDIGKINISDSVLNKPGKLTDEEYEIIKTHTTAGRKIMEKAISTVEGENYLKEARNMTAYHHERWDGKGYPEGLHGEVIPLSARIMAVADVFDALTSPRVYKPSIPFEQAVQMIQDGSGTQFDSKCVEAFM
ncbi:MAG: HD domain-containing protein, partial [Lachnospiraceae bacterium]|nr:HD domain-containing protein [Lachnospiraceae bacterium]